MVKEVSLALVAAFAVTLSFPAQADRPDGGKIVKSDGITGHPIHGIPDRILIRKNPAKGKEKEIIAYVIPKSVSVTADELDGLRDDEARNQRVKEILAEVEKVENLIENPKQVVKIIEQRQIADARDRLERADSTPACWWRGWRWGGWWPRVSVWTVPMGWGWGWGWGGAHWGCFGGGWGW